MNFGVTNPFDTPAPTYFTPSGTLTAAGQAVPAATSGWSALGSGLGSLLANIGGAVATQAIAGRLPGNSQYQNPTLQNAGTAGSPGTTPVVSTQLIPGIGNGVVYGAGIAAAVLVAVLIAAAVRK